MAAAAEPQRADLDVLTRHVGEWTWGEFLALPDEDGRRYEVEDGSLVVSPMSKPRHERAAMRLALRLAPLVPDGWEVVGPINLGVGRSYRGPDLSVISSAVVDAKDDLLVVPDEVLLVVEVVSRWSRLRDRVTKRAEYAAGGVRHYWVVDTADDGRLDVFALPEGADEYDHVGTWRGDEAAELTEPFAVRVVPSSLV